MYEMHDILFDRSLSNVKCVVTITLGLQPRQGVAKVRAKSEAQESPFMLLGV
jgi:ribosomal protein S27E